jgi:hypothetical protein
MADDANNITPGIVDRHKDKASGEPLAAYGEVDLAACWLACPAEVRDRSLGGGADASAAR